MFCGEYDPPQELLDRVRTILWRPRLKTLDLDTARQIQTSARTLRQASEDMVTSTIGKDLFPFLFNSPDQLLCVSQKSEWTDALDISSPDWTSPPPLISFPKPDVSVGIHPRKGLSLQQLQAANMFQEERRTFAQPDKKGGMFPGLVVESKSACAKGGRYVGVDQANLAMGTMLRAFQTMHRRVYEKDHFSVMEPRAFSIVLDQEFVTFNFEWMFRNGDDIEVVNLYQTEGFWLGRIDDIRKAYDLGQNLKDWLLGDHILWVRKLLDDFWIKEGLAKRSLGSGFKRRRSSRGPQAQLQHSASSNAPTNSSANQALEFPITEEERQLEGPPIKVEGL